MKKYAAAALLSVSLLLTACGEASSLSSIPDTATEASAVVTEVVSNNSSESSSEQTAPTVSEQEATTTSENTTETAKTDITTAFTDVTTTTAVLTTTTPTSTTTELNIETTVYTIVTAIGKEIEITNVTPMAASMIGAEDGISFKVNGNKFEVYKFAPGDAKLKEAESGHLTVTLQGFGAVSSKCSVNGVFVMMYETPNDDVIKAFKDVRSE